MVNFGPLAAEILSLVWGSPGNFNGFRVLAALLYGTSSRRQPNIAALNRGRHLYATGRPSRWAFAHILVHVVSSQAQRTQRKACSHNASTYNGVGPEGVYTQKIVMYCISEGQNRKCGKSRKVPNRINIDLQYELNLYHQNEILITPLTTGSFFPKSTAYTRVA